MEFKNSRYIVQLSWRSIVVNLENKTNQEHNLINHKMAPKPIWQFECVTPPFPLKSGVKSEYKTET